jgi:hypothetical protein
MSSEIEPDQTKRKECTTSFFDITEGLEQHVKLEHKWKNMFHILHLLL